MQPVQSGVELAKNGMLCTRFPVLQKESPTKAQNKELLMSHSMILREFVPQEQTVVAKFYDTVLKRLLLQIPCVRLRMYRRKKCSLVHENGFPQTAIHIHNFLSKHRVTVMLRLSYSPDLPPAEFFYSLASSQSSMACVSQIYETFIH